MKIFSGPNSTILTANICTELGIYSGSIENVQFPSGECYSRFTENIRGSDVFLVQSLSKPVNDNLMSLLVACDAARRASAGRITAVIPYLSYSRQDRKTKSREPISAKLVVDMLQTAGFDRILTIDLHNPAIQGFTNLPFDHLYAMPVFVERLKNIFRSEELIVISPDIGGVKRASVFAEMLGCDVGFIIKKRKSATEVEMEDIVGDVMGRNVIIYDDIAESCGTLLKAAALCKNRHAKLVNAAVTHACFTDLGYERLLSDNCLNTVFVTDTVLSVGLAAKLQILSVSPLFARAIKSIHNGESISELFQVKGY